jgi:Holliday junction resolvase RusA-like endonuclease
MATAEIQWLKAWYKPSGWTKEPVTVTLDLCPSVNGAWRNVQGRGRALTQEYKAWMNKAIADLIEQKPQAILGEWECEILMARPSMRADVDNRIKPALDLIKDFIASDDRYCTGVTARWDRNIEPGKMRITVRPA